MRNPNASFSSTAARFKKHLAAFKTFLKRQASEFESEVKEQAKKCILPKGKYLRPMLVFCAAASPEPRKDAVARAAVAELIHLSSLIHDDVIDNASLRRGSPTAYKTFGAKNAVLLGDALFAHAMSIAFDEADPFVWKSSVDTVKSLCQGEIMQSLAAKGAYDYKKYLQIIDGKTAALFKFSCGVGAACAKDEAWTLAAQKAGLRLGRAYQMYDDICDWLMSEKRSGKTAGTDFVSEKYTLPVIALLSKLPKREAAKLSKSFSEFTRADMASLMKDCGVVEECKKLFDAEISAARAELEKFGGKSEYLAEFAAELAGLMPEKWGSI